MKEKPKLDKEKSHSQEAVIIQCRVVNGKKKIENSNFCVCCGTEIPEGTMICNICRNDKLN